MGQTIRLEGYFIGKSFMMEFADEQQLRAFVSVSEYLLTLMEITNSEPKGVYERVWNDLNKE